MTLKFDGWPWKITGLLFYVNSSFANHFKAIGELKLEWQSGNAQFGSKSPVFVPCDLEIWWMTLKNNRAHLRCYFKIWASFHTHLWIQTGVTVQKIPIWVKIYNFLALWPWNLTYDHEKTIGHLFYATSNFMHHFIAICEFILEIQSRNDLFGSKSTIFGAVWPWNLTDDLEYQ